MTLFRSLFLSASLILTVCAGAAHAQDKAAGKPMVSLQMPALPAPAKVTLAPAKTGLLLLDYVDPICKSQPQCINQMMPAFVTLMDRARKAGIAAVAYGTRERTMDKWLPQVAPDNRILGAATLDRIRHGAYRVVIEGESFRKPRPIPGGGKGSVTQ